MSSTQCRWVWFFLSVASFAVMGGTAKLSIAQPKDQFKRRFQSLEKQLAALEQADIDLRADVRVYAKGVAWALRYETNLKPADVALIEKALDRGEQRAAALVNGKHSWATKKGRLVRGYVSAVDGSTQPFGLVVPKNYNPARPMRLDVVLHGSSRPTGFSELKFINRFDRGDQSDVSPVEQPYIELHPLGRVENCYRWAGETDVFEAIEAVCRNYNIDRDRIVLRGMSMGASGTWHLGLKHPDRFVALGPYCGYVDTYQFSRTPLKNFIVVPQPLPHHQHIALHMLDSVDYAANAGVVPAIACIGEKDVFFDAHVIMGRAMKREGLKMVNIISPGTGHKIDPVTHREQMRRIGIHAKQGINHTPRKIRFVTWTLKYNRCHWIELQGLEKHYARAELQAKLGDDGSVEIEEPRNITRFAILSPVLQKPNTTLHIGGKPIDLPGDRKNQPIVLVKSDGRWQCRQDDDSSDGFAKRPGLQGPLDDAFTSRFLCVRGTGKPWNPQVHAWSEANLKRFAYEWNRYFRGPLPIKDDVDVTEEDLRQSNLILFGDPGSNPWIAKVLPHLPIQWSQKQLHAAGKSYPASQHAISMIHPNPLPTAKNRYVVINSGHTFHEKELASLNYLLFPRLGDWAVIDIAGRLPSKASQPLPESVLQVGFFDERWRFSQPNDK